MSTAEDIAAASKRRSELRDELAAALNRASAENGSNTADFILADYLIACLDAWNLAIRERDSWYDMSPAPGWKS